ncbi:hypothetical protein ACF0HZ_03030 [Leuconostoc suionicum]|uniref:hypothetical protein n=1 Tax=Leuconostoc suionicum TaxID=1511761 RepID=UPI003748CD18
MTNSHEQIKQAVMRQSALQEIKQTMATFQSLEASLDKVLESEVSQLNTQYQHLSMLADGITDPIYKQKLALFSDNRIQARQKHLTMLLAISRESQVNAREVLQQLIDREENLK